MSKVTMLGVSIPTADAPAPAAATATATARAPALPDPELDAMARGEDIGSAIAAMAILSAKESRKAARAARDAAQASTIDAEVEQLRQMQNEATAKLLGGLASGGATVLGGVGTAVGGAYDASATARQNVIQNTKTWNASWIDAQRESAANGKLWSGAGQGLPGAGKLLEAVEGKAASGAEEAAKRAEIRAEASKKAEESAKDDIQEMREAIRKAMDLYKEYLATRNDAQKAAILRA